MIDQVPLTSTGVNEPFPADGHPVDFIRRPRKCRRRGGSGTGIAAHGDSERSHYGRADAIDRRRVLRDLPRRSSDRPRLRQARAGQTEGRRRLARPRRAQPLGGRMDARGRRHCPGGGSRDPGRGSRDRLFRDGVSRRRTRTRSGRICFWPATSTRRRRRPSATCSAGFTPRRRTVPTSRRGFRPTTSSTRSDSSPISSPRRARTRISRLASTRSSRRPAPRSACWSTAISARRICCIGPAGPVILDAECAWYGDPAFDLAFVLNHLLLKGAWRPQWRARYLDAYAALARCVLRARRLGGARELRAAHGSAASGR